MTELPVSAFARCSKALSDPTRVRVLRQLAQAAAPLCVCELKDALGINLYNVSRYLKELKDAGFAQASKDGRWVYYSLHRGFSPMHASMVNIVLILSDEQLARDAERMQERLRLRREERCVVGPAKAARKTRAGSSQAKGADHARRNI